MHSRHCWVWRCMCISLRPLTWAVLCPSSHGSCHQRSYRTASLYHISKGKITFCACEAADGCEFAGHVVLNSGSTQTCTHCLHDGHLELKGECFTSLCACTLPWQLCCANYSQMTWDGLTMGCPIQRPWTLMLQSSFTPVWREFRFGTIICPIIITDLNLKQIYSRQN